MAGESVLFYAGGLEGAVTRLMAAVAAAAGPESIVWRRSPAALAGELAGPAYAGCPVVVYASSRSELDELVEVCSLVERDRLIVILPDREEQTLEAGRRLEPRLISWPDDDFDDAAEVLKKVLFNNAERAA